MSKKFVRNITDTELRGDNKEPLETNIQNDILSDSEDVFIRNKDEYHCLTDNIKHITSDNGSIAIERRDKNTVDLRVLFGEGGEPLEVFITVKENSKEYLLVNEITPNHFEIGVTNNFITDYEVIKDIVQNLPEQYYSKEEINNIVKNLEEVDLSNYYTKEEIDNKFKTFNPIADVEIKSNSSRLHVLKKDSNDFQLDLDLSGYAMEGDMEVNISSTNNNVLKVEEEGRNNFTLKPNLENYARKTDVISFDYFDILKGVNGRIVWDIETDTIRLFVNFLVNINMRNVITHVRFTSITSKRFPGSATESDANMSYQRFSIIGGSPFQSSLAVLRNNFRDNIEYLVSQNIFTAHLMVDVLNDSLQHPDRVVYSTNITIPIIIEGEEGEEGE